MFGLLDYQSVHGKFNVGDYIQSLAAKQYLPNVNTLINREELSDYTGKKLSIILNGWFMHKPEKWPPSSDIDPLFISFHMNRPYIDSMLTPEAISYFKQIGSIGCRDYYTAEVLESKGVDSYYSSCLTTTLSNKYFYSGERTGVLLVDVMHNLPNLSNYPTLPLKYILSHFKTKNIFKSFLKNTINKKILDQIPEEFIDEVEVMNNSLDNTAYDVHSRYNLAETYLEKFSKARLVITSRIHCALPCLALGTPVIYIKYGQSSLTNMLRFHGILDHMNVIDLDKDIKAFGFKSNLLELEDINVVTPLANPDTHLRYTNHLEKSVNEFLSNK